jgi:hypothetical protein
VKRILMMAAGIGVVATVSLAGVALGRSHAVRSLVAIQATIAPQPVGYVFKGPFRLMVNGRPVDSGSSSIVLNTGGALKLVDGQSQQSRSGSDTFKGKKGTLTLVFRGVGIAVTTSTRDSQYEVEYGTWTISTGDGMYKGWRGGGRWANASVPTDSHVEWDGYASH